MSEAVIQKDREVAPVAHPAASISFTPRFDLWENDNEFLLVGDLPGVQSEDLDIQFEKRELRIHGRVAPRQSGTGYFLEEYGVGDFYRTFATGETVDAAAVKAELKDGVLSVRLPKRAEIRPRKIEVKAV